MRGGHGGCSLWGYRFKIRNVIDVVNTKCIFVLASLGSARGKLQDGWRGIESQAIRLTCGKELYARSVEQGKTK